MLILNDPSRVNIMLIVITGDLKSSKKMNDRKSIQNDLRNAIHHINSRYRQHIVSDFKIIGGDGFQGLISRTDVILDIYFSIFQKIHLPFYLGVGTGSISTSLSQDVQEIDGEAFHNSSNSLITAKKKNRWIVIKTDSKNNDLIECILNFLFEIMWKWNERRRQIILFYRNHGENSDAIKLTAQEFEVGTRNIYKHLELGQYSMIKYGEEVLKAELKKNDLQHN